MNKKFLLTLATAIAITAVATTALAAPLPAGTILVIQKTTDAPFVGPLPGCTNGSCFGMQLFSPIYAWTPLGPGTDGGLIIGKGQKSGGQEVDGLSTNNGELTEVWYWGGNYGTFSTTPNSTDNVFDETSCYGASCIGKTELKVWNVAWGEMTIPAGSAIGCTFGVCTADQIAGIFVKSWTIDPVGTVPRQYRLTYNQVPATNTFSGGYQLELVLSGTVTHGDPLPPVIVATPANLTGVYGVPIPFTITVTDRSGMVAPTCRSVNGNGKEIKICPTTTATYNASTNTPGATVVCKVKSNTARGKGHVKVNDHIKCTDKPVGNDKLGIKIKSGVNQKAM